MKSESFIETCLKLKKSLESNDTLNLGVIAFQNRDLERIKKLMLDILKEVKLQGLEKKQLKTKIKNVKSVWNMRRLLHNPALLLIFDSMLQRMNNIYAIEESV